MVINRWGGREARRECKRSTAHAVVAPAGKVIRTRPGVRGARGKVMGGVKSNIKIIRGHFLRHFSPPIVFRSYGDRVMYEVLNVLVSLP